MNYEEKYNEILEWARKNKARLNGVPIEEVLPELAESEDERIRRKMIEHFKAKTKETWCNMPVKDIIAYLEKQKEQKPAEWSEEDERIRKAILGFVNPDKGGTKYSSYAELVKWSDWLKSLRPSWKPSEEQMEALLNTLHPDDPYYHDLKSLYEQLKKL